MQRVERFRNKNKFLFMQKLRNGEHDEYSLKPFDLKRCIFVHIPRTGGVSISKSLFNNFGGGHCYLRHYTLLYSKKEFYSYFKFTIVRNPWDRLVSAYNFFQAGGMNEQDRRWGLKELGRFKNFDIFVKEWINRENIYKYIHFVPQYKFLCLFDLKSKVDFMGYFETIDQDFRIIKERLNIKAELLHINKSTSKDYRYYYSDLTRDIVADAYREDIRMLGYDFENTIFN